MAGIAHHERLDVLKALGDNTRYAIYLELARSPSPLSTAQVADSLGLHPNTVRPHLERMRDVGLLDVGLSGAGAVGRPTRLYSLAGDAPTLGLEPPVFPMLSRMLLRLAADAGLSDADAAEAGRVQGEELARCRPAGVERRPCVDLAVDLLAGLGFDPARVDAAEGGSTNGDAPQSDGPDSAVVAFTNCPFVDLIDVAPELVCSLHRGLLEGFVGEVGGSVESFHDRSHREPCLAEIAPGGD